ncbi:MAG: dCTP deaminase domain-containing protein [Syntrophobacteraceae bacterium]
MPDKKRYFAKTIEEAISRYEKHKSEDPFPRIPPALLSSAQIQAYISKTGMVWPYFPADDPKEERVTSASLTMTIGPEVLYWDSEDKQQYYRTLTKDDSIILRPNSITFLRPAEQFNLPDYIAARFNLRIIHVHRGLLLGTGPLMDPGFKGYPMIPVHNLTENEYTVRVGDDFINVEFTKLECNSSYHFDKTDANGHEFPFKYLPNRMKTCDYNFTKYIDKNVPQRKVKSSLSAVIDQAKDAIKQQKEQVEKAKEHAETEVQRHRLFAWISIIVAGLAIAALIYGGYQLTISSIDIIDNTRAKILQLQNQEQDINEIQRSVRALQIEINKLRTNTAIRSDASTNKLKKISPDEKSGKRTKKSMVPQ